MSKKNALLTATLGVLAGLTGTAATIGAANAQAVTQTPPPAPVTVTTRWSGAPETREEDRRFRVNGRIMYDVASTDADYNSPGGATFVDGTRSYFRRAFIGVEGRLTEQWRYNVKFDITPGATNTTLDDAYFEYASPNYSFIAGNNNAVSPMEDRDSSLVIPFNERSLIIGAGGWGKRPGVAFITNGGNWSLGASLQSNDAANTSDTAGNGSEAFFVAARGTWAPIYQTTPDGVTLLHLGVSVREREMGDGNGNTLNSFISYTPTSISNKAGATFVGVGAAESDLWLGAEFAAQWNAFGIEAEYANVSTDRGLTGGANAAQAGDADWNGFYVDLFWSPTGESRAYRAADGSFGAVRPNRTLGSDGGIGHIMLTARYEQIDLSDAGFANAVANSDRRQEQTATTLGVTWIPIDHVKFQLNYAMQEVDYTLPDVAGQRLDNEIDTISLRTQFDW